MICGHNEHLRQRLQRFKTRNRLHIEGFTKEIPQFMHLCDFFVGKPGPGSISEAIKMKLPVIVESNAWTLPQERFNADWVSEEGVGIVLKNFTAIEGAVRSLLSDGRLQQMAAKAAALNNQAVFEIPAMLEQVLNTTT
jgi:1,2-diacylglycerol 3-beta-galactosyltransferase